MACSYCGELHPGLYCPLVRALDFYESGTVRRVEFIDPPQECPHRNKMDLSVSGVEHWICKDCNYEHERKLS